MTPSTVEIIRSAVTPTRNYISHLENLIAGKKYVVFYGAGGIFNSIVQVWNNVLSRKVDFVCDRNAEKHGKMIGGVKCISPAELDKIKHETAVFITIGRFKEVYDTLMSLGGYSVHLVYKYDISVWQNIKEYDMFEVVNNLAAAYDILEDDISRDIFVTEISRTFKGNDRLDCMSRLCISDQYFAPDVVSLTDHECFADIGAFTGDTMLDFCRRVSGRFGKYYAFELCHGNYIHLEETAKGLANAENIELFDIGIGDEPGSVLYGADGSDCTAGEGDRVGRIDTLDNILGNRPVTFIKMDIEGFEPRALKGAENIIKKQNPKCAICVYHELEHLWSIPLYLKSLVPEYKIRLRHHTMYEYETVCYATID